VVHPGPLEVQQASEILLLIGATDLLHELGAAYFFTLVVDAIRVNGHGESAEESPQGMILGRITRPASRETTAAGRRYMMGLPPRMKPLTVLTLLARQVGVGILLLVEVLE
jgi:hypothetical protein